MAWAEPLRDASIAVLVFVDKRCRFMKGYLWVYAVETSDEEWEHSQSIIHISTVYVLRFGKFLASTSAAFFFLSCMALIFIWPSVIGAGAEQP